MKHHPQKCKVCDTIFTPKRSDNVFCSIACANIASGTFFGNRPKCEQCGHEIDRPCPSKTHRFCSKTCEMEYRRRDRVTITCEICGTTFQCQKSRSKNRRFCSRKCMGVDVKKRVINRTPQYRSFGECAIICLLRKNYPTLKVDGCNRDVLNGYELDIWLPELKVGIEYNGPHHYKPTYGIDVFEKTKASDARKREIAAEKNIRVITINANTNISRTSKTKISKMFDQCRQEIGLPPPTIIDFTVEEVLLEQGKAKAYGNKGVNLGRKATDEQRSKMSNRRSSIWTIKHNDGTITTTDHLHTFCKNHNMQYTYAVSRFAKNKPCKGWSKVSVIHQYETRKNAEKTGHPFEWPAWENEPPRHEIRG